ncbi:MAG: MFS transporter [Woeseia sp.]|nr:MFS transporter [Woeseia sp.]NNE60951.1 MFS transporter [Woeseia sp.]NNL53973.1 MFS transporter [Woeseia sp.]
MNEFRDGWRPLLAATIGTMCGIFTLTNYSQGFFVGPVTSEFGWTAPQFFLSYTVLMCSGLLTGPLVGSLAQKFGLRIVGVVGLIGHSLGYVLLSFNTGSLPLWYATWATLAIMGAGSLPIVWTGVLNDWFAKHRGKAIGITMAGTGLGAFLLPPTVEFLISDYGWRTAYRSIGIGALLISLPIVLALFREKSKATAVHDSSSSPVAGTWGLTRHEAMRTTRFWILGSVLFVTVIVVAGLLSNFERIMTEKGFERNAIAQIAAVMGLTVIAGRLLVGALVDRYWAPGVAACIFVLPTVGLLLLANTEVTFATGMLIAVMVGLAAGAELDLLAYLTSKYFGPANYPAIFGVIIAFFTVGAGIAPPLFGAVAQANQGYTTMLQISVGMLVLSILLFIALGKYPDEVKKDVI